MLRFSASAVVFSCVITLLTPEAHAMIWVGTPVGLAVDPNVGSASAALSFQGATLTPCSGGNPLDLGAGSASVGGLLQLPAGTWCGLTLEEAAFTLAGTTSQGQSLYVEVHASSVVVDVPTPSVLAQGQNARTLTLFAPDWLDALGVDPSQPVSVAPGQAGYAVLVDELSTECVW